jgi:maltooligosyltrehalose trehalohydrolase
MKTSKATPCVSSPVGAQVQEEGGTYFRVWAPTAKSVAVVFEDSSQPVELQPEREGYFAGLAEQASAGAYYKLQLDGGEAYPDPASRFQPTGPHGYSEVIDAHSFRWTDQNWPGVRIKNQVIYEMHIGTFTQEGTWSAAAEKLQYLKQTGITVVEVMPVSTFPGKFGWGYDGVQAYAPVALYGRPDDMRSFVDQAHALGIGVILDVVYNHLGPDGNYLTKFSPFYLSKKHRTDWGQGINFDGENSAPVREYFCENAAYWVREYHLDGLRLDATQDIHDDSEPNIILVIGQTARAAAGERSIILIGENEPQQTRLLRSAAEGGYEMDALWNDDYHHSAIVALTGKADAYYTDYRGTAQEFVSAAKYGYLYQGQWYRWQKKRRGSSTFGLPRTAMVNFIQNHDQIANSARGQRVQEMASPGVYKALTAMTLLMPGTPMLFQGQEFASSSKFLFFADHKPELAGKVRQGRAEFLAQWRSLQLPEMKKCFDDPSSPSTFERSKLDHSEVKKNAGIYALHRDLLHLRREDPVLSNGGEKGIDGAVLNTQCFVLRYFSDGFENDRLLLVNLGTDLELSPAPEPLLAPPASRHWVKLWSSDEPQYGGCGTAVVDSGKNWRIPGMAAVVLYPILVDLLDSEIDRRTQPTA